MQLKVLMKQFLTHILFNNNFPNFKVNSTKITKGTVNKFTSTTIKGDSRIKILSLHLIKRWTTLR